MAGILRPTGQQWHTMAAVISNAETAWMQYRTVVAQGSPARPTYWYAGTSTEWVIIIDCLHAAQSSILNCISQNWWRRMSYDGCRTRFTVQGPRVAWNVQSSMPVNYWRNSISYGSARVWFSFLKTRRNLRVASLQCHACWPLSTVVQNKLDDSMQVWPGPISTHCEKRKERYWRPYTKTLIQLVGYEDDGTGHSKQHIQMDSLCSRDVSTECFSNYSKVHAPKHSKWGHPSFSWSNWDDKILPAAHCSQRNTATLSNMHVHCTSSQVTHVL